MRYGTGFALAAMEDTGAIRDFAQALDGAGFDYVTSAGHLLSAEPGRFPDRPLPTYVGPFHDPFVLFSYLAAITTRLGFRNSILILPLFPTAVVAKQAAELSLLSGGRFELGVGISWNPAEYEAVNQNIHNRGKRVEEQIAVLRMLWSKPFVSFQGRWHSFDNVGLNRLPVSPIPLLIGSGTHEPVLRRAARLADGWIPLGDPTETIPRLRRYVEEAGRDPVSFRITGRVTAGPEGPASWVEAARRQQDAGVTDLTIGAPPGTPWSDSVARTLEAKRVLAEALG